MELNAEVVALDIGASHVTAIRIVPEEDKVGTVGVWKVGLPPNVWDENGNLENADMLTKAIKLLKKRITPKAKRVYISISNQNLLLQPVQKPSRLESQEIANAVRYDIMQSLPYDDEHAQVSYNVLGRDPNNEEMLRILAISCHKDVPVNLMRAVQAAGLEVEDIEPEPCIMNRSIKVGENQWAELLVSIGKKSTSAMVISNKNCEYAQGIHLGGEHLTEMIAQAGGKSLAEAEQFKRRHSLIGPNQNDPFEKERAAMKKWADRLVEAVYGVLTYQEQHNPARRVVLTGGGSKFDGLKGYMTDVLGIPIEYAEPIEELQIEEDKEPEFLNLSTAYALALHPVNKKTTKKGLSRSKKDGKDKQSEAK